MRTRALALVVAVVSCVGVGLTVAGPAGGATSPPTFVVNTTADTHDATPGDGTCADSTPACSLRAAVEEANALGGSATIDVPPGTYTLSLGELVFKADLTVFATGTDARTTVFDGNHASRVICVLSGTSLLNGVTVTNGNGVGSDALNGSVYCANGVGGGIQVPGGALTINQVRVTGNTATVSGGGVDTNATLHVTASEISGNTTTGPGYSIGGGIDCFCTGVDVVNSTISGNSSTGGTSNQGGGILAGGGTITLLSSTIAGNTAGSGGGLYDSATVSATNTIVSGNTGGDCNTAVTSNGHNLSGDASCGFTGTGDHASTDPLLGALANNGGPTDTMALGSGSPAIDAADDTVCLGVPTDQRGITRPQGAHCDIGAYEATPDSAPVSETAPQVPASVQQTVQVTATPGGWTGSPTSYSYQWIRCDADGTSNCGDISGATSQTFTPSGDDVGKTLRVRVTAANAAGSSLPAVSGPSSVVAAQPDPVITNESITQTQAGALTLTAHVATGGVPADIWVWEPVTSGPGWYYVDGGGSISADGDVTVVVDHDAYAVGGAPNLHPGATYQLGLAATTHRQQSPGVFQQVDARAPALSYTLSGPPQVVIGYQPGGCSTAPVNGTVNPYGTPTTYHWLLNGTQTRPGSVGTGWSAVPETATLTLAADQTSGSYTLVASNQWGTTSQTATYTRIEGCDPVATPATNVTTTSATLNAGTYTNWRFMTFLLGGSGALKPPSQDSYSGSYWSDPAGTGAWAKLSVPPSGASKDACGFALGSGPVTTTVTHLQPGVNYAYIAQIWLGDGFACTGEYQVVYSNVEYFRTASTSTPTGALFGLTGGKIGVACLVGTACVGQLTLTTTMTASLPIGVQQTRRQTGPVVLGTATYHLAAHHRGTVFVRLTRQGRAVLKRHHRAVALLTLAETERGQRTKTFHRILIRMSR